MTSLLTSGGRRAAVGHFLWPLLAAAVVIGQSPGAPAQEAPAVALRGDFQIKGADAGAGNIVVTAYSEEADWLHRPFFDNTSFQRIGPGGTFLFTTDLSGRPAESRTDFVIFDLKSQLMDPNALDLIVPPGQPRVIQVPFWPVPGFGRVWVTADNGGRGYVVRQPGGVLAINFNYEAARTQVRLVGEKIETATGLPAEFKARLDSARALLAQAANAGDEPGRANLADAALAEALRLGEDVTLELARRRIPSSRMGSAPLRVVGADGRPVAGAVVRYQQVSHDFLFGVVQSFGFVNEDLSKQTLDGIFQQLADAGFNHYTVHLSWVELEKERGRFRLAEWDGALGVPSAVAHGFSLKLHSLMQDPVPSYLKSADPATLRAALNRFSEAVIDFYRDRYGSAVAELETINEPSTHLYGGPTQADEIALIKELSQLVRQRWPGVPIVINDVPADMGQRFGDNEDLRHMITPLEMFERLDAAGVDYDRMGLEWYPGLQVNFYGLIKLQGPLKDLFRTSRDWERYTALGKPLHITEFAVPGRFDDDWESGWWRRPWDPQVQADFAERIYTLAFSNPDIHEMTYWGITDDEPWVVGGGLFDKSLNRKPMLDAIARLIKGWTSAGELRTDSAGRVTLTGYAGSYQLTIEKGGVQQPATVHVSEQVTAPVQTLVFNP